MANPYLQSVGQLDIFGRPHHKPRPAPKGKRQTLFGEADAAAEAAEKRAAADAAAAEIEAAYRRFAGEDQAAG